MPVVAAAESDPDASKSDNGCGGSGGGGSSDELSDELSDKSDDVLPVEESALDVARVEDSDPQKKKPGLGFLNFTQS